jgi:hypothetical protein
MDIDADLAELAMPERSDQTAESEIEEKVKRVLAQCEPKPKGGRSVFGAPTRVVEAGNPLRRRIPK